MSDLNNWGVDYASPLPAMDNAALNVLIPTRLSPYVIQSLRYTLPAQLFLSIDMDVDLCQKVAYLCEDTTDVPRFNDGAIDGPTSNVTLSPPRIKEFHGFHKGSFQTKLAKEQLECMNRSPVLMAWYRNSLDKAIENGRQSILSRFYMFILANGVHPQNKGMNAGLASQDYVLGTPSNPILLDPDHETSIEDFYSQVRGVLRQMPDAGQPDNEFGKSVENAFVFTTAKLEDTLMQYKRWNDWNKMGDCVRCSMMEGSFERMPYGIFHITSRCVAERNCKMGQDTMKSYPVLFGKRYQGAKAAIRVENRSWESQDGESIFFRTNFYFHIHVYDCRNMGLAWITLKTRKPLLASCGV